MRYLEKIMFIVESDSPSSDLDSILENGAELNGFDIEEVSIGKSQADGYHRLTKQ